MKKISSPLSSPPRPAHDRVVLINKFPNNDKSLCIGKWTFSKPNTPDILRLSIMLLVVSQHARMYRPLAHQCYWYASTVAQLLHIEFKGQASSPSLSQKDRGGTYCSMVIPVEDNVATVRREYQMAWEESCKKAERARAAALTEQERVRRISRFQLHS